MTTTVKKPKIFGTGLIALDLVMGIDPQSPVRSWAGGTCGNVLSILSYLGWDAFPIARMNGDPASRRVMMDMKRWGVRLDFAGCGPTSHTPIIIQEIRRGRDGTPRHRFSWSCPRCGLWLPGFKAVTVAAVETIVPSLPGTTVFFMDRLSRSALTLAARASAEGAVVVFEPSSKSNDRLFAEALQLAHIVKYSDQRMANVGDTIQKGDATLVEIQTLGSEGLMYRHRLGRSRRMSGWLHLDAVPAPYLADTCGSGDWLTAGLLAKAAANGQIGLRTGGAEAIHWALRYGQALAAWNCGFEGARAGMYAMQRAAFENQINDLLAGRPYNLLSQSKRVKGASVACPACPPDKTNAEPLQTTTLQRAAKRASVV